MEFCPCVLRVCIFPFSSKTNFANSCFSLNILLFYGIGNVYLLIYATHMFCVLGWLLGLPH